MAKVDISAASIPSQLLECLGFQQLTVSTAVLTFTVPANAQYAILNLDSNPIRVTLDGTNPTASLGLLMAALDVVWLSGRQLLVKAKVIRGGGADGILNIHYFK